MIYIIHCFYFQNKVSTVVRSEIKGFTFSRKQWPWQNSRACWTLHVQNFQVVCNLLPALEKVLRTIKYGKYLKIKHLLLSANCFGFKKKDHLQWKTNCCFPDYRNCDRIRSVSTAVIEERIMGFVTDNHVIRIVIISKRRIHYYFQEVELYPYQMIRLGGTNRLLKYIFFLWIRQNHDLMRYILCQH